MKPFKFCGSYSSDYTPYLYITRNMLEKYIIKNAQRRVKIGPLLLGNSALKDLHQFHMMHNFANKVHRESLPKNTEAMLY